MVKYNMNSSFYSTFVIQNDQLYIADCDRHLKIYNIPDFQTPVTDIDLLDTWGLSIVFHENLMYLGTDDHKIKIFDQNFTLLDELEGHKDGVCL